MNPTLMHKNYFDRAEKSKKEGCFLEAIFLEYAAIEGRLEVLCGLFSCPCNKELPDSIRKDIKISQRVNCLKKVYNNHPACLEYKTKLSQKCWSDLLCWLRKRNMYVHGLYKRPEEYINRNKEARSMSEEGYDYADLLYKEVKRVRRLRANHPEKLKYEGSVCDGKCGFLKN